jgi:5-methyltetrahydropteroyltriglutamate--homocysteine methyltransferase
MKRSSNRILTTHVGSLPRPDDITAMVRRSDPGRDPVAAARLREAIGEVVRKQIALGIDVVDDGEFSKTSFVTYVRERLGGLTDTGKVRGSLWGSSRDAHDFPEFYRKTSNVSAGGQPIYACTGPMTYRGQAQLQIDLDNLKAALAGHDNVEAFVPSISLANIESWNANEFYNSDEEYLTAIAEAMHVEYKAITDAGFLLQIDDPRLVTYYMMKPELTIAQCRQWAERQVEALNYALRGIPREKIRYHTCYSINMAPRVHDMEVKDIIDIILKVQAGAFSFEASNPRHEHEWAVWRDAKKPADTILIPGVVSHCTVLVEHPELVAERLIKYANFAGRENVIAGSDCGFASFAGADEMDPSIAWAKLDALVKGAEIASKRLTAARPVRVAVASRKAATPARKIAARTPLRSKTSKAKPAKAKPPKAKPSRGKASKVKARAAKRKAAKAKAAKAKRRR